MARREPEYMDLSNVTDRERDIAFALHVAHWLEEFDEYLDTYDVDELFKTQANAVGSWQSMWAYAAHDGDCVSQPQMCQLCMKERLVENARRIIKELDERGGEPLLTTDGWIPYDMAEHRKHSFGGMGGFFQKGMRWKDFLDAFKPETHKYAEAIRREMVKRKIKQGGDWHQGQTGDDATAPVFSDGTVATFSYRSWGDISAAVWSEHEDHDYCYMDFYMIVNACE